MINKINKSWDVSEGDGCRNKNHLKRSRKGCGGGQQPFPATGMRHGETEPQRRHVGRALRRSLCWGGLRQDLRRGLSSRSPEVAAWPFICIWTQVLSSLYSSWSAQRESREHRALGAASLCRGNGRILPYVLPSGLGRAELETWQGIFGGLRFPSVGQEGAGMKWGDRGLGE